MKKLFILFLTVIFISTIFTASIFADAVESISISSKACPQLIEKTYNDISYVAEIKNDTETIYPNFARKPLTLVIG